MSNGSWTRIPIAAGIGLLIGLVAGGAGAGYVWWNGQQDLAAAQTRYDELSASSTTAMEEHAKAIDAMEQQNTDLAIRVEVARALDEVQRMNFGTAQDRLKSAQGMLDKASDGMKQAASSLADVRLEATEDTGAQRDRLAALARELDSALK